MRSSSKSPRIAWNRVGGGPTPRRSGQPGRWPSSNLGIPREGGSRCEDAARAARRPGRCSRAGRAGLGCRSRSEGRSAPPPRAKREDLSPAWDIVVEPGSCYGTCGSKDAGREHPVRAWWWFGGTQDTAVRSLDRWGRRSPARPQHAEVAPPGPRGRHDPPPRRRRLRRRAPAPRGVPRPPAGWGRERCHGGDCARSLGPHPPADLSPPGVYHRPAPGGGGGEGCPRRAGAHRPGAPRQHRAGTLLPGRQGRLARRRPRGRGHGGRAAGRWGIASTIRDVSQRVREAIFDLRTSPDPGQPFSAWVRSYVARFAEVHSLEASVEEQGRPVPLPLEAALHAMAVVREALHNVAKHAGARRVHVRIEWGPAGTVLTLADDGRGLPDPLPGPAQGRYGLLALREHARAVGGDVTVGPRPGGGTEVALRIPAPRGV